MSVVAVTYASDFRTIDAAVVIDMFLLLLIGIGLAIYGWRRGRRQEKRLETPQQVIRLWAQQRQAAGQ